MRISRKAAATTAIAGLVLALSACSSSDSGETALDPNADLSLQTLTVSNWAAYNPDDLPAKFEEDLVNLAPPAPADSDSDPGQFWTDYIRDTSPEFRKPTIEQLETFIKPTWQALIDGAMYCEPQLREIIKRVNPDVIVEDNVVTFPALLTAGKPFVRIVSCNPLEVKGARSLAFHSALLQWSCCFHRE